MPHGRLAVWYFWYFAFIGAFLPYFALYLQSIGMSAGRIAVLMSLGQFMRLVAPLLWSWLADSGGRRVRIVVASTAAALASFSVVFLTEDFVGLLLGMAVLHFFWSASLPLVEALTLGHLAANPERYGRVRLWGSIGFIVTVMGVGLLLDLAPIRSQLWVSWVSAARDAAQRPDPDRGERACGAGLRSHHRGAAPAQGAVPARCGPVHDRMRTVPSTSSIRSTWWRRATARPW
jgi:MFS family permease